MKKESGSIWKLGMFVILGAAIFVFTIYFVGKQKSLFGSTFVLKSNFKTVSGLKVGNNIRFSGINIGTVSDIQLITDTSVLVSMLIKKDIQQFIKTDALASIGSDGLMGEKVLSIFPGGGASVVVKDNDIIASKNPIEMDAIMVSVKTSVDNISIISNQLAAFTYKLNNGKGALSKLMNDEKFGKTLDTTMQNLKKGTKGLSENMEAAKSNFLLKGFFNKKKRADAKKQEDLKKEEDLKNKPAPKTPNEKKKKDTSNNQ